MESRIWTSGRRGIYFADPLFVDPKRPWIDGWKIRNWFDWWFAVTSFFVFVTLEGVIIYSYFTLLKIIL
jgi:hypothetical protein